VFSRRERFRLWWSYQRYALALARRAAIIGVRRRTGSVVAVADRGGSDHADVYAPGVAADTRKLRATALAIRRSRRGFRARSVAPCW
jgi:hypothetical protein